jgi:hypothetical protein
MYLKYLHHMDPSRKLDTLDMHSHMLDNAAAAAAGGGGTVQVDQASLQQILQQLGSGGGRAQTVPPPPSLPMPDRQASPDYYPPSYQPQPPLGRAPGPGPGPSGQRRRSLDDLYEDLKFPLFVAALYFLFQLPFVHHSLATYAPMLLNDDGNITNHGNLLVSVLFGAAYYAAFSFFNEGGGKN